MKIIFISLIPVLIFFTSFHKVQAQSQQLHVVFINSFIKYINWLDKYNVGDFKIAVVGNSTVIRHLNNLADAKKVHGRNILINSFQPLDQVEDAHILYLPENNSSFWRRL